MVSIMVGGGEYVGFGFCCIGWALEGSVALRSGVVWWLMCRQWGWLVCSSCRHQMNMAS